MFFAKRRLSVENLEFRNLLAGLTLVQHFDTWNGDVIPSSDPAGITYHLTSDTLYISDSEINEIGSVFQGHNVFEVTPSGDTLVRPIVTNNSEPTGITFNEFDGFFYVTNDNTSEITRYDSTFAAPLATVDTTDVSGSADDPEGITSDPSTGELYVAQGVGGGKQVFVYSANLQFLRSFSVGDRVADPEGIAFNESNSHLYIISSPDLAVFEYTTDGTYVNEFDISGFQPAPISPQGITFGPTSDPFDDPNAISIYIADAMIDNGLDGRIYEAGIVNQAPLVDAGANQPIVMGQALTLSGSAVDDGLPNPPASLATSWQVIAGPGNVTFSDSTSPTSNVSFSEPGSYTLRLRADDGASVVTDDVTIEVIPPIAPDHALYFSFNASATLPGNVIAANEDIAVYDGNSFQLWLDGSDVGLTSERLDAFSVISSNEVLISLTSSATIPGISGTVDDSDIVLFTASKLGPITSGVFSMYLDGSDVGLTTDAEDIDSVKLLSDGSLLISTYGSASVPGLSVRDEDIMRFTPTSLGDATAGTWDWYLDGGDIGLGREDINAVGVGSQGELYLSLDSDFSISGLSGSDEDVLVFLPNSVGSNSTGTYAPELYFNGSDFGISGQDIYALDIVSLDGNTNTNTPPLLAGIPDLLMDQATSDSSIDLDNYYSDFETPSAEAIFEVINTFPGITAAVDPVTHVLTVTGDGGFVGEGDLTLRATDTGNGSSGPLFDEDTLHVTVVPPGSAPSIYFAVESGTTLGELSFANEDIIKFDGVTFSRIFDGSDVGLNTARLDGLAILNANEFLMSFVTPANVPGIAGEVDDSDIVKFTATQLGDATSGTFEMYFDGSDVGLDAKNTDIDALDILDDGRLIISTLGAFTLDGIAVRDEDLLEFTPTSIGETTSGTWSHLLDGSDIAPTSTDINGVSFDGGNTPRISLQDSFDLDGVSGDDEDIVELFVTQFGGTTIGTWGPLLFDGSNFGLSHRDIRAFDVVAQAPANAPLGIRSATAAVPLSSELSSAAFARIIAMNQRSSAIHRRAHWHSDRIDDALLSHQHVADTMLATRSGNPLHAFAAGPVDQDDVSSATKPLPESVVDNVFEHF